MLTRAGTELEAANAALSLAQEAPIGGTSEANNRARAVVMHFGTVRDAVLAEHPWNFATAYDRPARKLPDASGPLARRYPLPADCLTVRYVADPLHTPPLRYPVDSWAVEAIAGEQAKVLVTDGDPPLVCYTRRVPEPALWDALFLVVFQLRLGAALALAVPRNRTLAGELNAEADRQLARARRVDGREAVASAVSRETSWIRARR